MQTPSHGWPSTWIPSASSQDITASSHSLIWPPSSHQMVPQKKHYMRLCPRVSCARSFWSVARHMFSCTLLLPYCFPVFLWVLFPSISTPARCPGGCRGADCSLSPCWNFFSSWAETGYREVFGQKLNRLRAVTAATPSALKWLSTILHWLQHLPAWLPRKGSWTDLS